MKILLVEDNRESAEAMCEHLKVLGHEAQYVTACVAAEHLLEYGRYDAVVLDWLLHDERGTDVIEAMRARGDRTPAILMTAAGDSHVKSATAGLEDVPILYKPFDAEDLLLLLEKVASATRRRAEVDEKQEREREGRATT